MLSPLALGGGLLDFSFYFFRQSLVAQSSLKLTEYQRMPLK